LSIIKTFQEGILAIGMSTISNSTNLKVNINSMIGRLSLQQTEAAYSKTIQNLSTGIRIRSGRDDPTGFIASAAMRTEIVSMSQAVANSQRADSVISTIDSTLANLNNLLNDLRGLVTQAANTGAENTATLASLQYQADAVLDTIDFLSTSTAFQNRKLLDGSLDFTTYGIDNNKIDSIDIHQANFLGRTEKDVYVQVLEQAQRAELYYSLGALKSDVVLNIGGTGGYQTFSFDQDATIQDIADAVNRVSDATGIAAAIDSLSTPGNLGLTSYGKNNDVILTASEAGAEKGNFVVRYTAPKEGNDLLALNLSQGNGNEPTVIEVVLQTERWENAQYHYNANQDGVSNNEFSLTAKYAAEEWNGVQFSFNNVYGTDGETGMEVDWNSIPKTFTVNVSYNENDPADPENTTVNDFAEWLSVPGNPAGVYFELEHSPPSDGTGALIPAAALTQTKTGVNGGAVLTTAEQIVTLINTSPLLKNPDGTGMVSATLPSNSTGLGTVTAFADVSYYGSVQENNYLQFLAPEGSPKIRFVSEPGTPLSVDDSTFPPQFGYSSAQIQGLDSGTSFSLESLSPGIENDSVTVRLRDASEESVVFDVKKNEVVISVDFTGRANDPARGDFSMEELKKWVADDPFVRSQFRVVPLSPYDPNNPPTLSHPGYLGIDANVGKMSGGLVSEGTVLIYLETDSNGIIKTTANDLVRFFNDPSDEESKAVLDRLGISVSSINPADSHLTVSVTGESNSGAGLLKPTDDPAADCVINDGDAPDILFSSYGNDIREEYPTATVMSQNGHSSDFTITARNTGAAYNNTAVRVLADADGPNARYDAVSKELIIGIPPQATMTVDDAVALINNDPALHSLFVASRGPLSDGNGRVGIGDGTTLTGGIEPVNLRAEGTVVSANGVNAAFEVTAKRTDDQFNNTEVIIVADSKGPVVSYDASSKQLTIGVNAENLPTARTIVDLINATAEVRDYFEAAIPVIAEGTSLVPTGEEQIHLGDRATLQVRTAGASFGAAMIGGSDMQNRGITFYSVEYGSQEFVSVQAAQYTDFPLTDRFGNLSEKSDGTDITAKINGQFATGTGCLLRTAASDLDLSIRVNPNGQRGDVFGFRISGGGTLIQLGPDAVPQQQARIAVKSIHTISLGGVNGFLSQLRTNEPYDLLTDTNTAFKIVEEVITDVTNLRGRLGAFQKNRIETNIQNMTDSIEIETNARSEVADADFAEESSALARQQLLMQANTSVLQQNMQNVRLLLGLLQQ
jgi:flagellin-like hook-associated protein FlgL